MRPTFLKKERGIAMKRKLRTVFLTLVVTSLLVSTMAFAYDGSFDFAFETPSSATQQSTIGYRDPSAGTGKNWYVDVGGGSLSTQNVLGMRPRKYEPSGAHNGILGSYQLYTRTGIFSRTYSTSVQPGDSRTRRIWLHAKKDDSSSSTQLLTAYGDFTP